MRSFDTITSAVEQLQHEGFQSSFEIKFDTLMDLSDTRRYHTTDFEVSELLQFETQAKKVLTTRVYAIETKDKRKGILIDDDADKHDPVSIEMVEKLQLPNRSKKPRNND
jgi:hypothetical protein